jgi:hypothetical protein
MRPRDLCVYFGIAAAACLAGCAALPEIQYVNISKPADATGVIDSFYLAQSEITIDGTAAAKAGESPTLTVTSKPVEYTNFKIGIVPSKSIHTTTTISITKRDNTDLVSTIGVQTTDNTLTIIQDVGAIAVKAFALAPAFAPAARAPSAEAPTRQTACIADIANLPITIDIPASKLKETAAISQHFDTKGTPNANGCIAVALGTLPPDAIPVESIPYGVSTSNYYYAACRDATLTIDKAKYVVRIADPYYVEFVQLPFKGQVKMHTQCGISVTTDQSASDVTGTQIVNALLVQAQAIKDAQTAAAKK